jgi:GNAT superfamily N-acetyltransferase
MTVSLVRTRLAGPDDVAAVQALHDRCSPDALHRRFHVPTPRLTRRDVEQLVVPRRGWSVVAEQCDEVVGHGCVGELAPGVLEVGLLVEDAQQGRGIGARLLRDLAVQASERGYRQLVCVAQADNDQVLRTVRRAGLPARHERCDGLLEVVVALGVAGEDMPVPA